MHAGTPATCGIGSEQQRSQGRHTTVDSGAPAEGRDE
jgi:hypothetical protein